MREAPPAITVLMPVYNAAPFLGAALESILAQSCGDFEFLAIDDGSCDGSSEILAGCRDRRLRIHRNPVNIGVVASLNVGIALARGRYIARMDADDLSAPSRLERQLDFLETHPEVGICSTWATFIDEKGRELGRLETPVGSLLSRLFWRPSPLVHAAVMGRSSLFKGESYSAEYADAEDYELWLRLYGSTSFHNLPEPLYFIRRHGASVSSTRRESQLRSSHRALCAFLGGPAVTFEEFTALLSVDRGVAPWRRTLAYLRATRRTGVDAKTMLRDTWEYARGWLDDANPFR